MFKFVEHNNKWWFCLNFTGEKYIALKDFDSLDEAKGWFMAMSELSKKNNENKKTRRKNAGN